MFILNAITRAQSSRWVSRLFCVAWLALTVPGSGKLGPSTQNRGLQINSSGRGETHYKSYSFGFVHLQRVTTKWKKKLSEELMETEKEERKKRDRNVANQITRENSCLLVCKIMKWRMLFDILGADWNFPCSKINDSNALWLRLGRLTVWIVLTRSTLMPMFLDERTNEVELIELPSWLLIWEANSSIVSKRTSVTFSWF